MQEPYPNPVFHFIVQFDEVRISFSEITGLDQENQAIKWRDDSNSGHSDLQDPGRNRFNKVILKRGIVKSDSDFFKWITSVKRKSTDRRDVIVSMLNENLEPIRTWKLHNALPVKVDALPFTAKGDDVAMESIEFAHEGIELEND